MRSPPRHRPTPPREAPAAVPARSRQTRHHPAPERHARLPAVLGRHNEVLGWNRLAHLLLAGHLDFDAPMRTADRPNLTRMLFLDPHTRDLYRNWHEEASLAVASERFLAAQHADDRELAELIGELTLKRAEFATLWARHVVQRCTSGVKQFHHPEVGDVDLAFDVLHLPGTSGHRIMTHTPEPGSLAEAAINLLTPARTATEGTFVAP